MKATKTLILIFAVLVTNITLGQSQNDQIILKKKHLQYLKPRLDGRKAKMTILFGDLNGDGVKDAFVDWCIEATENDRDAGGGNALMFLECMEEGFSVYINTGKDYVLTADKGKDNYTDEGFSYSADKIEKGKIFCSNICYADNDPRCCPSLTQTIYLVYKNNKILKPQQIPSRTKQKTDN